jgi:hypothetical protein
MSRKDVTTYRCDRCGAEVQPSHRTPVGWTAPGPGWSYVKVAEPNDADRDLCETCTTAHKAWFEDLERRKAEEMATFRGARMKL